MFEIYQSNKSGEFYFRLKAKNGDIILGSEGYKTKSSCKNGIESVRKNSMEQKRFISKTAKNGKFHFNLKARNGQIIGTSQMYTSENGMKNGMNSVKKNAQKEIKDLSN